MAPTTVTRIVHLLSASLNAAIDAEIITSNPATRIRVGGGQASPERFLTREEFAAVRERLLPQWHLTADVLVGTGLRWGEAAGAHHHRVNRVTRSLEVAESWSMPDRTVKGYPKGRRRRSVPIPH